MTVPEMIKAFESLTPDKIRELAVQSVWENELTVKQDLADANDSGLTFAGNPIDKGEFTDWIETGRFRRSLKFLGDDIELISYGEGYDAIVEAFDEEDYIAPTAKVLTERTMSDIKHNFIEKINEII